MTTFCELCGGALDNLPGRRRRKWCNERCRSKARQPQIMRAWRRRKRKAQGFVYPEERVRCDVINGRFTCCGNLPTTGHDKRCPAMK